MRDDAEFETPFEKTVRANIQALLSYDKQVPLFPGVADHSEALKSLLAWTESQRLTSQDAVMTAAELMVFHICALNPDDQQMAIRGINSVLIGMLTRVHGLYEMMRLVKQHMENPK